MRPSNSCPWVALLALTLACGAEGEGTGTEAASTGTSTGSTSGATDQPTGSTGSMGEPDAVCEPLPSIPLDQLPQIYAETICAQKSTCGCEDFACGGVVAGAFAALVKSGTDAGLAYDEACAAGFLYDFVTARGCSLASNRRDLRLPCPVDCRMFQGTLGEGEPCTQPDADNSFYFLSPCQAPFFCLGGTCRSYPATPLAPGATCFDLNEGLLGNCQDTLCDSAGSGTCEPILHDPGADCSGDGVCDLQTMFCNDSQTCEAFHPVGAACNTNFECTSVRCAAGTCEDYTMICEVVGPSSLP